MNHLDILASSIARLTAAYQGEQREKTQARLVGALRAIPPAQRASEANAAIHRLEKQETLEAKIKALSNDDLDKIDI